MIVLLPKVLWMAVGALGWAWFTRPDEEGETGEERVGKATVWAVAAVAAVAVLAWIWKR